MGPSLLSADAGCYTCGSGVGKPLTVVTIEGLENDDLYEDDGTAEAQDEESSCACCLDSRGDCTDMFNTTAYCKWQLYIICMAVYVALYIFR